MDANQDSTTGARYSALALLVSREHSAVELQRKLAAKGFNEQAITRVMEDLQARGLQSDERFTEAYVRSRQLRGYGPQRIEHQLYERGVHESIIKRVMDAQAEQWPELIIAVRLKRFGEQVPEDYQTQAKQMRFLQYRGFSHEQIRTLFNNLRSTASIE